MPCDLLKSKDAEDVAARLKNWREMYGAFVLYGDCDDGGVIGGIIGSPTDGLPNATRRFVLEPARARPRGTARGANADDKLPYEQSWCKNLLGVFRFVIYATS